MKSITNIQTSQTRVYRDHSLELKAWEFLKEKVWSGAAHVSRGLSKCLCSPQHLMRRLSSQAKHIMKMESRLLTFINKLKGQKSIWMLEKNNNSKAILHQEEIFPRSGKQGPAGLGCHEGTTFPHLSPSCTSGAAEPHVASQTIRMLSLSVSWFLQTDRLHLTSPCLSELSTSWRFAGSHCYLAMVTKLNITWLQATIYSLALYTINEELSGNTNGVSDTGEWYTGQGFGSGRASWEYVLMGFRSIHVKELLLELMLAWSFCSSPLWACNHGQSTCRVSKLFLRT